MSARVLKFPERVTPAKPKAFSVFVTVSDKGTLVATIRRNGIDDVVRGAKGVAALMKRLARYFEDIES